MRFATVIFLLNILSLQVASQDCRQSFSGIFSGKDLFVQNPFLSREKGYCIKQLFINDSACIFSDASVFLLDLKKLNFIDGDSVSIYFLHDCGCKPRFLNPPHHLPTTLSNLQLSLTQDSFLLVQSLEKKKFNMYYFQQYRWNRWNVIDSISVAQLESGYRFPIKNVLHSGENRFRVSGGDLFVTKPLTIPGPEEKDFNLAESYLEDTITFPHNTCYEIWDGLGMKIVSGCGSYIDISKLYKGQFILNYDNKSVKFSRK